MAAIEAQTPQFAASTINAAGTGGGRRRNRGRPVRNARVEGADDGNTAPITATDGPASGGPGPQDGQSQQPRRPRNRRPNRPQGEKPTQQDDQHTNANNSNGPEMQQPGSNPPSRPRNRRGRGPNRDANTTVEVIDSAPGQQQQSEGLNWQQQLLFDQHQQQQSRSFEGQRGPRQGGGQSNTRQIPRQPGGNQRQGQGRDSQLGNQQQSNTNNQRNRNNQNRVVPPRGFGGRLTIGQPTSLRADAAEVQPSATDATSSRASSVIGNGMDDEDAPAPENPVRPPIATNVKTVKEAEDLMTRIHNGLASGSYECMICYGGVTRKSRIWDCSRCYAVFHLKCIGKWAKQGLEAPIPPHLLQNGQEPPRTWRCPGCQNLSEEAPSKYECWCGKLEHPEVQRYIAPHSCGQTCGKQRISPRACPHACDLQCHAGPCPPCTAMGPVQACYCGKKTSQRRCLDTDYENGWSCQEVCGDMMPCGDHTCPKPCHSGMCGDCEVEEELMCYCGKHMKAIKCCDKTKPMKSVKPTEDGQTEWIGHWFCNETCERKYDCSVHSCQKSCHPSDLQPAHCPLSPDVITHCPCGKTRLTEILDTQRKTCQDPIPSCNKPCNKVLKCGHRCTQTCHDGDCGACLKNVDIACRCGRTISQGMCHQGEYYDPPQCMRTCKIMLNCQRHECGEKCCSGEAKALERLAASKKKKGRSLDAPASRSDESFEPEHICTRPCGKLLKCGKHNCPMLCHRGPCGSCLEASFEELSCHCGRTVIQPPVPCGTRPPQCPHQCVREKSCNHPAVPHSCHSDTESCPKCPYLTVKKCVCGKKEIKNQPCFLTSVTCGTICGKKLSCGSHTCKKICHRDGECDEPCTQACGKSKSCGHPDTDPCHAPFQCSETTPCPAKITISCSCGGIKQDVKCNATKSKPAQPKEIKCNDTCRARRLALALEIDPDRDALNLGYSDETIKLYYEQARSFTTMVEKTLRAFAESASQKRFAFQPMKSSQREFIHNLAEDYGLDSESQDPEPYRNVVVVKGHKFIGAPKKSIADFIKSNHSTKPAATPANAPLIEQLRKPGKFNALVLHDLRIGLLTTELEKELAPLLNSSQLRFNIHWSGDEEVVLNPVTSSFGADETELELNNIKPVLRRLVVSKGLAQDVDLCWVGKDGKISARDNGGKAWTTASSGRASASGSGTNTPLTWARPGIPAAKNGFSALDPAGHAKIIAAAEAKKREESERKRVEKERKQKEKEREMSEVVEDWEAAMDEEERSEGEAERRAEEEKVGEKKDEKLDEEIVTAEDQQEQDQQQDEKKEEEQEVMAAAQ